MTKQEKKEKKTEKAKEPNTNDFDIVKALGELELNSYVEIALLSYIQDNNITIKSTSDLTGVITKFNKIKNGE